MVMKVKKEMMEVVISFLILQLFLSDFVKYKIKYFLKICILMNLFKVNDLNFVELY